MLFSAGPLPHDWDEVMLSAPGTRRFLECSAPTSASPTDALERSRLQRERLQVVTEQVRLQTERLRQTRLAIQATHPS